MCVCPFTRSVLIPDSEGAVVGGRRHPGDAQVGGRQEHTAGGGLHVAPVLHHLTARLTQVPQLGEER